MLIDVYSKWAREFRGAPAWRNSAKRVSVCRVGRCRRPSALGIALDGLVPIQRCWDLGLRAQRPQRWLAQSIKDVVCGGICVFKPLLLEQLDDAPALVDTLHRSHHLRAEVGSTDHADSFSTWLVESRKRAAPVAGRRARATTCRCPREVTACGEKPTKHTTFSTYMRWLILHDLAQF